MPHPVAIVDYQKCHPSECNEGICVAALECPNKVLTQEARYDFPFSHPSHFCRGCAKCVQACPVQAIRLV